MQQCAETLEAVNKMFQELMGKILSKMTPGVVLKSRFVLSDKSDFDNYVEYIDREEAKKKSN